MSKFVLLAAWFAATSAAWSVDCTWINNNGGNFSDPLNWNPNQAPGTNDTAIFNIITPSPYTVTFTESATNKIIKAEQGEFILNLNNHCYAGINIGFNGSLGKDGQSLNMTISNGIIAINTGTPYYGIYGNTTVRLDKVSGIFGRITSPGVKANTTLLIDNSSVTVTRYNVYGGALIITNNACLDSGSGNAEYQTGSVVRIIGTGSYTRAMNLTLNCTDSGGIYIADGGVLKTWGATGRLCIMKDTRVTLNNGTLFSAGGVLSNVNAIIEGAGIIGSTTHYNGGLIRPGGTDKFGKLINNNAFINSYADNIGTIEIKLGGKDETDHDKFAVLGAFTACGTLRVTLCNGFKPNHGDAFDILDFGSISGSFDTLDLPSPKNWDISNLYATGEITWSPPKQTLVTLH